jgi:hypothetical protein
MFPAITRNSRKGGQGWKDGEIFCFSKEEIGDFFSNFGVRGRDFGAEVGWTRNATNLS